MIVFFIGAFLFIRRGWFSSLLANSGVQCACRVRSLLSPNWNAALLAAHLWHEGTILNKPLVQMAWIGA